MQAGHFVSAVFAISFMAGVTQPRTAYCQDGQAANVAAAEVLYREAKQLARDGKEREACDKFALSQKLDPGTGTLLAVAQCDEHQGRISAAWLNYTTVAAASRREGRTDRLAFALSALARVENAAHWLVVRMPLNLPVAGRVELDGVPINTLERSPRIPIEPGIHELVASADGFDTQTVRVSATGQSTTVDLPLMQRKANAHASVARSTPTQLLPTMPALGGGGTPSTVRRPLSVASLVAGVGGLAAGGALGIGAAQNWSAFNERCDPARCTDPGAVAVYDRAGTFATLSTIAFVVGALLVTAGVVSLVTEKRPNQVSRLFILGNGSF